MVNLQSIPPTQFSHLIHTALLFVKCSAVIFFHSWTVFNHAAYDLFLKHSVGQKEIQITLSYHASIGFRYSGIPLMNRIQTKTYFLSFWRSASSLRTRIGTECCTQIVEVRKIKTSEGKIYIFKFYF